MLTPLAAGLIWGLSGTSLASQLQYRKGPPGVLDPLYQLPYAVHFVSGSVPWSLSLALVAAALALACLVGGWRVDM